MYYNFLSGFKGGKGMATIKDVARLAGVSPSTVSRALHNSTLISRTTKERIHDAMKKLNYSPNFAAQNLANSTSNIIGVVLPPNKESVANNPFFSQILQGIAAVCNSQSYMVVIAAGKDNADLMHNVQKMVKQGKVNKFILTYSQQDDCIVDFFEENHIEYVVIGEPLKNYSQTLYVNNDNVAAARDATNFLFEKGYHYPVYIYNDYSELVQRDRFTGYMQVMHKHHLTALKHEIDSGNDLESLKYFLTTHPETDSFIVSDDLIGLTLQNMLANFHQDHYGIISFNNSIFAHAAHPALTSVEIFPDTLGMEAAVLMLNTTDKDFKQIRLTLSHVIVPHKIIERQSTIKS